MDSSSYLSMVAQRHAVRRQTRGLLDRIGQTTQRLRELAPNAQAAPRDALGGDAQAQVPALVQAGTELADRVNANLQRRVQLAEELKKALAAEASARQTMIIAAVIGGIFLLLVLLVALQHK
jgi:hypothetical protein